jgi:hypothetical protein
MTCGSPEWRPDSGLADAVQSAGCAHHGRPWNRRTASRRAVLNSNGRTGRVRASWHLDSVLASVPSVESAMTDGHNGSLDTTTEGDSRSRIFCEIDFAEQKFRTAKARWNRWYYCGTAGSVVFPALAAVVLKLESVPTGAFKNDVAALLAAMGAVCASVLADGKIRSRCCDSQGSRRGPSDQARCAWTKCRLFTKHRGPQGRDCSIQRGSRGRFVTLTATRWNSAVLLVTRTKPSARACASRTPRCSSPSLSHARRS